MQYQGTIASVIPDGGYQSQNGWIYRFNMTINSQNGPVTGEIGSKTEFYPLQQGEQIVVTSTNDSHGTKFKKVNPGYQQQQPPQQGNQAGYQPQNQQVPPQPQQQPPQQNIQDNIAFGQAYNLANADHVADKIKQEQIKERTQTHYNVLKTRQFPALMSEYTPPPQQEPSQQSQEDYDYNKAFNPTDDIPF